MCRKAPGCWTSGVFDLSKLIYRPPSQVIVAARRSHSFFSQPAYLSASPADILKKRWERGGSALWHFEVDSWGRNPSDTRTASDFRGVSSSHSRLPQIRRCLFTASCVVFILALRNDNKITQINYEASVNSFWLVTIKCNSFLMFDYPDEQRGSRKGGSNPSHAWAARLAEVLAESPNKLCFLLMPYFKLEVLQCKKSPSCWRLIIFHVGRVFGLRNEGQRAV